MERLFIKVENYFPKASEKLFPHLLIRSMAPNPDFLCRLVSMAVQEEVTNKSEGVFNNEY
jgi:hypothetical protein